MGPTLLDCRRGCTGVCAFLLLLTSPVLGQSAAPGNSTAQLKQLSLEDLMQLDVTSVSRQPQTYESAAASIDVVTGQDIDRSGATSIPEALRLADNLQVAQVSSSQWAISARGFNNTLANKLLVLIDGRTVYTPLYAGVFWDAQDYLMHDVDRIEVISGPGGTLWGENAVNGVINITTKSAQETQGAYVSVGGGNQLQGYAGARYGTTLATNLYFRTYVKYTDSAAEFKTDTSDRAGDEWQKGQAGFRADWLPSLQNNVTFQGDFYDGDEGTPNPGTNLLGDTRISGGNVLGRLNHSFAPDNDLTLQLYFDQTHRDVPNEYREDLDTADIDIQDSFAVGERHHFVWGGGYRFTDDRIANSPALAFIPSDLDRNLFNTFIQDDITLATDWRLVVGTKLEHNDWTGFEVEPNGRLSWNVAQDQMLWTAVSRAVRTPSEVDEDLFIPGYPPYVLAGGTNVTSETVIAYETGYRAQITSKASASISGYYNDYDHLRSLTPPTTPGGPLFIQNNLEGTTYGFEANASYQPFDWWRLHGGYNLLQEHLHERPGAANTDEGENYDPQQQVSFRSSMDLPHNLQLELEPRWVDRLYNTAGSSADTIPAYFELNARLAYRISSQVEISIVGENLIHAYHQEFGFPVTTAEQIGRSIYGKVVWQF